MNKYTDTATAQANVFRRRHPTNAVTKKLAQCITSRRFKKLDETYIQIDPEKGGHILVEGRRADTMADTRRTNGEDADIIKADMTSGQQGLEERPRTRTQGGHKADKRQQHKADARRTRIEDAAKAKNTRRTRGGHMWDTWWTSGGQGLEARPKLTTEGGHKAQVADKDWRRGQS